MQIAPTIIGRPMNAPKAAPPLAKTEAPPALLIAPPEQPTQAAVEPTPVQVAGTGN